MEGQKPPSFFINNFFVTNLDPNIINGKGNNRQVTTPYPLAPSL